MRVAAELSIHDGPHRNFEWCWALNGTMPALDAYEKLPPESQNDFIASVRHWGTIPPGQRPARSRVNEEHSNPVVVALKAGKHRFTAFREDSGPTWIVCRHYLKEGQQRDKIGDRAVARTLICRDDYVAR